MSSLSFAILYEDNHVIAVDKPAGLLTQPTNLESDSLEVRVKAWIKEKYGKPGNVFLGVIHRLDRPASGIVLFAKTSKALGRLNEAMRNKQMKKTYLALVEGSPGQKQGTLKHYLRHDEYRAYVSVHEERGSKLAVLHYEVVEKFSKTTLLKVELETGRYHQIRAQFSFIGCPIVGDSKYGSGIAMSPKTIALHHSNFVFEHPVTKQVIELSSPLPEHFYENNGKARIVTRCTQ